jgi:hypothetical protein
MLLCDVTHLIRFMAEWSVQKEVVCHKSPQENRHKSKADELFFTHGNPPFTSSEKQMGKM